MTAHKGVLGGYDPTGVQRRIQGIVSRKGCLPYADRSIKSCWAGWPAINARTVGGNDGGRTKEEGKRKEKLKGKKTREE